MQKIIKYLLLLLAVGLVAYKSVYIKKLSGVKKKTDEKFDAVSYSKKLWNERLPAKLDSAIGLTTLINAIGANPVAAFSNYSNAMGIGNYRYSLINVTGVAAVINEDEIIVQVGHADSLLKVTLATEYVYGNAIRDASGLVDIKDFTNTADLNSISEELNKTVRATVLPPFKKLVKQGDTIEITAAVEFNKEHISFGNLELIPIRLKIVQ